MRTKLVLVFGCLVAGAWLALAEEEPSTKVEQSEVPPAVVKTMTLEAATLSQKFTGIANVIAPDALIQLDGDIRAADIAVDFSRREYERYKSTKSLSIHIIEGAQRQSETSDAQLAALHLRLRQTWGDSAPFVEDEARLKILEDLTSGKTVLVRLDFAEARGEPPKNVRVSPLSGGKETPVKTLWPAPTGNAAMPGISYFAIVEAGPGLRHQDRASAVAESGTASGVIIPSAALIVTAGETWCYVETAPEKFERRKVPLTWPVAEGYLVESGFAAGTKVVVRGASTLLSREAEPGDAEDDDGGSAKPKPHDTEKKPAAEKEGPSPSADIDEKPKAEPQAASPAAPGHDKKAGTGDDEKPAAGSSAGEKYKTTTTGAKEGDGDEAGAKDNDKPGIAGKKASEAPVTGSTSPSRTQ